MGVALVRAALGKSVKDQGFPAPKGNAFAWGEDKIMAIKAAWADHLEGTLPQAQGLKSALGYQEEQAEDEGTDEYTVPGTLEAPPAEEPEKPPGSSSDVFPSFKIGDDVVVTNRFTVPYPTPWNPNFMKDMNEGAQGKVLSWATDDHSKCMAELDVQIPNRKGSKETTW